MYVIACSCSSSRFAVVLQLLQHVVPIIKSVRCSVISGRVLDSPTVLLEQQRWRTVRLARFVLLAQLLQSSVDMLLVNHDAVLATLGLDTKLRAESIQVEFAFLKIRIRLQLSPVHVVSRRNTSSVIVSLSVPDIVTADELAAFCLRLVLVSTWETVIIVTAIAGLLNLSHEISTWRRRVRRFIGRWKSSLCLSR